MNGWKNTAIQILRLVPRRLAVRYVHRKAICQEKKTKNCTPYTIVVVPDGVQSGEADRYVHIKPSGEALRLVMEEPLVFESPEQVGENVGVPAYFDKVDELRSNVAIITALDSTDGPILVSNKVLDYVQSKWWRASKLTRRVFASDTGPTALRDDQGQIIAVMHLRSADRPEIFDWKTDT